MWSWIIKKSADIIYVVTIVTLITFYIINLTEITKYGDLINALFTATFVYLTYRTLKHTIHSEILPYINVKFILTSKLDESFIERYPMLKIDEQVRSLINPSTNGEILNKNLVFVWVENLGEQTAIEVALDIDYIQTSWDRPTNKGLTIHCGTLKRGDTYMTLIDKYDSPRKNDIFEVAKVITKFTTVGAKTFGDDPKKNNFSKDTVSENYDEGVSILFKDSN